MKPSSTEFYDKISSQYDELMDEISVKNRTHTLNLFQQLVPKKSKVLDFGGGTGTDSVWLHQNGYDVTFVDNSPKMEEQARQKFMKVDILNDVDFLTHENTNYLNWQFKQPLFDAVLANNSVINSIDSIGQLFLHFSKILNDEGIIIFTHRDLSRILKRKRNKFKYYFAKVLNKNFIKPIEYKGYIHPTILYSDDEVYAAYQDNFQLIKKQSLGNNALLICLKKL